MPSYIIDTDIGNDVDDAWALVYMLLRGVEIKMILVSHRNTFEKAKIVAKILAWAGRTEIPIAIGPATLAKPTRMHRFVEDFDLEGYTGVVDYDGLALLAKTLKDNPDCTILGLSPATSLRHLPDNVDVSGVTLVQMAGSFARGYNGDLTPTVEWNVREDIEGFKHVLAREWRIVLVPLDVATLVIDGADYAAIQHSDHWAGKTIMACYATWEHKWSHYKDSRSSTLFDVVAAEVSLNTAGVVFNPCQIVVTDEGFTRVRENGFKLTYAEHVPLRRIVDNFLAVCR